MKKIFSKFILMIGISFSIVTLIELHARQNDKGLLRVMKDRITQLDHSAEAYLLGASHLRKSINAELLSQKAVMLGIPGSAPNLDYLMWKAIVKDKNPKYIVLEISRGYLSKSNSQSLISRRKIPYYFDLDIRPTIKDNFLTQYPLWRYLTWKGDVEKFTEFGFKIEPKTKRSKFQRIDYDKSKIRSNHKIMNITTYFNNKNPRVEEINSKNLLEIIDYCNHQEIPIIIYTSPKYKIYNDMMTEYHTNILNLIVNEVSQNKNVTYWDFSRIYENEMEAFNDLNHLAPHKATEFTKMFDSKLQLLLNSN